MKSIINVDFGEEPGFNDMERLSKLYDVLGKLLHHQYNEWCQYRKKKTFQSFYACCHELINVAFIFTTLLTESQNRSHMSLNSIILLKWLTDYRILTKRFCHGIFADTYFDICDEKTMMKRRDVLMYINNAFYK